MIKTKYKEFSISDLFAMYNLKSLSVTTILNWMNKIGFKYEPRKKTYYVDTHESTENVAYCSKFIDKYFEYELLAHCWHSISLQLRDEMIKRGDIGVDGVVIRGLSVLSCVVTELAESCLVQ